MAEAKDSFTWDDIRDSGGMLVIAVGEPKLVGDLHETTSLQQRLQNNSKHLLSDVQLKRRRKDNQL